MAKIKDILATSKPTISFEVFPPKTESAFASVEKASHEMAMLNPAFMSVTYGAGGGTCRYTSDIAATIQNTYHVTSLAHLTCVSQMNVNIGDYLDTLKSLGVENVLALRGDLPEGMDALPESAPFKYASDLVREIKSRGDFCVGGACYPEGHPEAPSKDEDIRHIKEKVEAGCDFLTTQMFFDNSIMYNYMYRLRDAGITVPVCAGIMPITNRKQVERSMKLSGACMPARFLALVDRFGDDPKAMQQAGIAYATDQIIDLIANGVTHIHVYSMNKPEIARGIRENLSAIID